MKLYHWTLKKHLKSILKDGLKGNGFGIIYLTPDPKNKFGEILLEVETRNIKLTAFDDCRDWERLCWGNIPPSDIKVLKILNCGSSLRVRSLDVTETIGVRFSAVTP